jgi:hypothetical protein
MAVKRPKFLAAGLGIDPARLIVEAEEPNLMDLG